MLFAYLIEAMVIGKDSLTLLMKREGSISGWPACAKSSGGQCKKPAITGWSPLTPTETYRRPLATITNEE